MLHGEESKMDIQVDLVGKADGEGRDGDVKKVAGWRISDIRWTSGGPDGRSRGRVVEREREKMPSWPFELRRGRENASSQVAEERPRVWAKGEIKHFQANRSSQIDFTKKMIVDFSFIQLLQGFDPKSCDWQMFWNSLFQLSNLLSKGRSGGRNRYHRDLNTDWGTKVEF